MKITGIKLTPKTVEIIHRVFMCFDFRKLLEKIKQRSINTIFIKKPPIFIHTVHISVPQWFIICIGPNWCKDSQRRKWSICSFICVNWEMTYNVHIPSLASMIIHILNNLFISQMNDMCLIFFRTIQSTTKDCWVNFDSLNERIRTCKNWN